VSPRRYLSAAPSALRVVRDFASQNLAYGDARRSPHDREATASA
jgi:hypothetical protein